MKLNAASEMLPITLPGFANAHPFLEKNQREGYNQMMHELISMLKDITGFDAISLQPNAGAQGEFAGLLAIKKYHESNNQGHRNICLIPNSAHGTNPASAQMCGMEVSIVKCDDLGNVDLSHLEQKINEAGKKQVIKTWSRRSKYIMLELKFIWMELILMLWLVLQNLVNLAPMFPI